MAVINDAEQYTDSKKYHEYFQKERQELHTFIDGCNDIASFSMLWIKSHRLFLKPEYMPEDEAMKVIQTL